MTDILALEKLYSEVSAQLVVEHPAIDLAFGWREPTKQHEGTSPKVWFVPGDLNGALGDIGAPKWPGREPRPLLTLFELFAVYVWATDETAPENEFKQYKAVRLLYDAVLRAMRNAAVGTIEFRSHGYVVTKKERRRGAQIRLLATVEAMVPDYSLGAVSGVVAAVSTELLDRIETMTIQGDGTP